MTTLLHIALSLELALITREQLHWRKMLFTMVAYSVSYNPVLPAQNSHLPIFENQMNVKTLEI